MNGVEVYLGSDQVFRLKDGTPITNLMVTNWEVKRDRQRVHSRGGKTTYVDGKPEHRVELWYENPEDDLEPHLLTDRDRKAIQEKTKAIQSTFGV